MSSNANRRYPLIAFLTLAVLLLCVARARSAQPPDPAPLTLRLTDLPKGWRVGDDTGCGPMGTEGATSDVRVLVQQHHPVACVREFNKLWGAAKPFYVQSMAMTSEASGGADEALAAKPGLLDYFGLDGAVPSSTAVAVGSRSQVFAQPKAIRQARSRAPRALLPGTAATCTRSL
jgi:hypothetical protein